MKVIIPSAVLLFLAAFCESIGGIGVKSVSCDPFWIVGIRACVGGLILLLYFRRWHFEKSIAFIGCSLCTFLTTTFIILATYFTSAASAIILEYSYVVMIAFFSWVYLREGVDKKDWVFLALVMCTFGFFFAEPDQESSFLGNILALFAAISCAWTFLFLKKISFEARISSSMLGLFFGAVTMLPIALIRQPYLPSIHDLMWASTMGVFEIGCGVILFSLALKEVKALVAAMLFLVEPIFNPLWVYWFNGEMPQGYNLIGYFVLLTLLTIYTIQDLMKSKSTI